MTKAFIIGNGITRKGFNLDLLKGKGTIFGCNALYRDFKPDYLVAIDDPIIEEIRKSDFPQHKVLIPPEAEQYEPREYNPNGARSNAGMNAMIEAIRRGFLTLYCLGFDFLVDQKDIALANVYDGTNAYGPETRTSLEDSKRRVDYLRWFVQRNKNVGFKFVFPRQELQVYDILAPNVAGLYYDDLLGDINGKAKDTNIL